MTLDPNFCRCTIGTISYEQVKQGIIWCRSCGRIWDRTEWGWKPDPRPPFKEKPQVKGRQKGSKIL